MHVMRFCGICELFESVFGLLKHAGIMAFLPCVLPQFMSREE